MVTYQRGPDHDAPDPALREAVAGLQTRYRRLIEGRVVNLASEIEAGVREADRVLRLAPGVMAPASELISAVTAELSGAARSAVRTPAVPGASAQKLAFILLMGALVNAAGSRQRDSRLILLIDDPESHLHPITQASLWRLLEMLKYQKIVSTNSSTLLGNAPLASVRRLQRLGSVVTEYAIRPGTLTANDMRRLSYHVRFRRGVAMFSRVWLLVEGETEFWILPELARICGYDFAAEGITCVEYAQCGISPLLKLVRQFGMEWHLVSDGDEAGARYAMKARAFVQRQQDGMRVTQLHERDIEHCFWHSGYGDVFRQIARGNPSDTAETRVIARAIDRTSKPFVALALVEAASPRGTGGVPEPLRRCIEACVFLARNGAAGGDDRLTPNPGGGTRIA